MTPIHVRVATALDAPKIVAVTRASITELCVADHQNDVATLERWLRNKTLESVSGWLADKTGYFVVAEVEGVVCGVGGFKRGGMLSLLYVQPGYQRLGVGGALLRDLEALAERWTEAEIKLTSSAAARTFYERHGYVSSGPPQYKYGVLSDYPYVKVLHLNPQTNQP